MWLPYTKNARYIIQRIIDQFPLQLHSQRFSRNFTKRRWKTICMQKKLLTNRQFGFRRKNSTIDAIVYFTERVRNELNENKFTTCAFLDLSKVFDSINQTILLKKLKCLLFNDSSVKMLSSFLSSRMQRVVVNDETLGWIQLHHGVPQVTVPGPLLFNLYVNDLKLKTCEIIQYAGDTVLLTSHYDLDVCKKSLEHSIEDMIVYFTSLALKLNADKTEFIVFGKKNQPQSLQTREKNWRESSS